MRFIELNLSPLVGSLARIILDTTLIEFRVKEKAVPVSILHAHPPPRCCEYLRSRWLLVPRFPQGSGDSWKNSRKLGSGDVAAMDMLQRSSQTLYLVWTENRQDLSDPGVFSPRRDVAHLFTAHPDDTFLVRFAYWFTR